MSERAEPNVEVVDLGDWGVAWLVAEYDPARDTIRVNARAVVTIREALGDSESKRFIAVAIAHERYHRDHVGASETRAHAFARETCGVDPTQYERVLRTARIRA